MFGLQATAIGAAVALVVGFGSGYYTAHRFDTATELRQEIAREQAKNLQLTENIRQMREALEADATKQAEDATKIEELERTSNELKDKTSTGVALDSDDTKRLLEWWNATRGVPTPKSRSRAR